MARAETVESVGETGGGGGGGNGPFPRPNTCRMELPHPFHSWPGLLATTTTTTTRSRAGTGAIHHHHHHHYLQPLHLVFPLPDEPQTHQQLPASSPSPTPPPPSLLCNRSGGGVVTPSAFSGDESDSHREEEEEEEEEAHSRQGPLPDLLPRNERPPWALPHHRGPGREAGEQERQVRRVASQLRAIGDEFNATALHRAHIAPLHWQDWRDTCRGLLNFITQALSTLYRLT